MSVPSVLYGNTWVGDITPTTPVWVGQQWVQPTAGTIGYWNGTTWTYFGNINNNMGGAVEASGDTVTGPILNIPNVLPTTNPNALGTLTVNGYPVALQTDLTNLQNTMTSLITSQVKAQFLSQYQQSGTASDIAFYCNSVSLTQAQIAIQSGVANPSYVGVSIIPPTFQSDGIQATPSQILAYGWAPLGQQNGSFWVLTEVNSVAAMQAGTWTPTVGSRLLGMEVAPGTAVGNVNLLYWAFAVR